MKLVRKKTLSFKTCHTKLHLQKVKTHADFLLNNAVISWASRMSKCKAENRKNERIAIEDKAKSHMCKLNQWSKSKGKSARENCCNIISKKVWRINIQSSNSSSIRNSIAKAAMIWTSCSNNSKSWDSSEKRKVHAMLIHRILVKSKRKATSKITKTWRCHSVANPESQLKFSFFQRCKKQRKRMQNKVSRCNIEQENRAFCVWVYSYFTYLISKLKH